MSVHIVDSNGRLWKYTGDISIRDTRDSGYLKLMKHYQWVKVKNTSLFKPSSSIKMLIHKKYLLTVDNKVFNLETNDIIDNSDLIINNIVEYVHGYLILTVDGSLFVDRNTIEPICCQVKYIGPGGENNVLVLTNENKWLCLKFNGTTWDFWNFANEVFPVGDILSQEGRLILTADEYWVLSDTRVSKLAVDDNIIDIIADEQFSIAYCLANNGEIIEVGSRRQPTNVNKVIKIMHENYSKWKKLYHKFQCLILCNSEFELFAFDDVGLYSIDCFPKEMLV